MRIDRLVAGNPGDVKPVGEGISELRIALARATGSTTSKMSRRLILLLCGGDKSSPYDSADYLTRVADVAAYLEATRMLKSALSAVEVRDWPGEEVSARTADWRADVGALSTEWEALDERVRFAVLQQVNSVLRTGLADDVESRLR